MTTRPHGTGQVPGLPISAAAAHLGISRRTVWRRVKAGELVAQKVGAKWLIQLPEAGTPTVPIDRPVPQHAPAPTSAQSDPDPVPPAHVAQDTPDCAQLARDKIDLERQVNALTGERDFLRQALAAALTIQRQLPDPDPAKRPWWAFWR